MQQGRRRPPLSLAPEERDALRRWARGSGSLARRARMVLRCARGETDRRVAREIGVRPQTVGKWRRRFEAARSSGLLDAPRPGPPRRVGEEAVVRVIDLARQAAEEGRRLTTRALAEAAGLSQSAVSRILRRKRRDATGEGKDGKPN